VLDEPTNDLDFETLDLLLEVLDGYKGTLLLVSHDRDFLDRLVTGVIALEGGGRIAEAVGGYSDYLRQRGRPPTQNSAEVRVPKSERKRLAGGKLSYREQRELDGLPAAIERLNAEIAELEAHLADAGLYGRDPAGFETAAARLQTARAEREAWEGRWLELEDRREALAAARRQQNT
jgi:ATP-binding cassette subfamily F protein uup